jgi:glutathione S-transferase
MIVIHNFARGIRGVRIAWQCEEMGLAYRPVAMGYPTPPEYRAKYPPGSVPFVEDEDGAALGESAAIMLYLAQRYGPTPLLPSDPVGLARTLQLTVFSEAGLGGLINPQIATQFVAPDDQKTSWTQGFCRDRVAGGFAYAESLLDGRDYFVGEGLTLADIAIATALGMWVGVLDQPAPEGLAAHRTRMQARPAYQKALAAFSAA